MVSKREIGSDSLKDIAKLLLLSDTISDDIILYHTYPKKMTNEFLQRYTHERFIRLTYDNYPLFGIYTYTIKYGGKTIITVQFKQVEIQGKNEIVLYYSNININKDTLKIINVVKKHLLNRYTENICDVDKI